MEIYCFFASIPITNSNKLKLTIVIKEPRFEFPKY